MRKVITLNWIDIAIIAGALNYLGLTIFFLIGSVISDGIKIGELAGGFILGSTRLMLHTYILVFPATLILFGLAKILLRSSIDLKIGVNERMKSINWVNFTIIMLAVVISVFVMEGIMRNISVEPDGNYEVVNSIVNVVSMIVIIALVFKYLKVSKHGRNKGVRFDERTKEITNKSAHNAMIVTWSGLLVIGIASNSYSSTKPLVVIIIGVIAFVMSLLIYNREKNN